MNTTTPNDLDTTRCGTCGTPAWFDATSTGWTHDDPERDTHRVLAALVEHDSHYCPSCGFLNAGSCPDCSF